MNSSKTHLLSFDEYIKDFLQYIICERGLSKNTVEAYGRDLSHFASFLEQNGITRIEEVSHEEAIRFLTFLKNKEYMSSSSARALIAIKVFFKFLKREEVLQQDLSQYLDTPKLWQTIPDILTFEEVEALLYAPDITTAIGIRDKAIIEILYATGIRVSELCTLKIYDVSDNEIKVMGKGSKERLVPIGKKAIEAVDLYLHKVRTLYDSEKEVHLFLNKLGKPLHRVGVWQLIKHWAKAAKISKNISPHTLRHSFASHLLDAGADLRVIQDMLGHAHISSTDRYAHLNHSQIQESFFAHHPRWKG